MKRPSPVLTPRVHCARWPWLLALLAAGLLPVAATHAAPSELGRLFYSPAQRAQLEAARQRDTTHPTAPAARDEAPPPVHYDGIVIRSDGKTTRWVNGKPSLGASGTAGLKPGQIRAGGKIFEPYQVLRPAPGPADSEAAKP